MDNNSMNNTDKVSSHYLGASGVEYVGKRLGDYQSLRFEIDLSHFRPYLQPEHSVLEFGCGTGGMLQLIQKMAAKAEGLEVNPAAAEIARSRGCYVYENIDDLPVEPAYDVIVSNHVLEHVRDVCSTLEALRQRLKPDGLLVVKLPIDDIRDKHQRVWSSQDVDHHLQTWTPRGFANVLFESGFNVRECRIITSNPNSHLLPLIKFGLAPLAFWTFAVLKNRRQLLAVGENKM